MMIKRIMEYYQLLTSLDTSSISEFEKKSINVFLNLILGNLEKLKLTEKLNDTYEELTNLSGKIVK